MLARFDMRWFFVALSVSLAVGCSKGKEKKPDPRTAEATERLEAIFSAASKYFEAGYAPRGQVQLTPPVVPAPSVGPTPAVGSCCPDGCEPSASDWEEPTWEALEVEPKKRFFYSLDYAVGDKDQSFVARAIGDLDCDGEYSTFTLRAQVVRGKLTASAIESTNPNE